MDSLESLRRCSSHGHLSSLLKSSLPSSETDSPHKKSPRLVPRSTSVGSLAQSKSAPDFSLLLPDLSSPEPSSWSDPNTSAPNRGSWALGYLSILALLFVSCANVIMNGSETGPLGGDTTNYSSLGMRNSTSRNNAGGGPSSRAGGDVRFGAAAIQSITETLSPILPFVGGGDLRRDDVSVWELLLPESVAESWESDWYRSIDKFWSGSSGKIIDSASSATGVPRGGGDSKAPARRTSRLTKDPKRDTVLSASKPFLPTSKIAELTLTDITDLFRYALNANRPGFDEAAFTKGLSPKMAKTIEVVRDAVATSRGGDVKPADTHASPKGNDEGGKSKISTHGYGDVDALQFCAALRVFAEWRVQRLVPEGFKGYAVGMNLGHKDVVQNLVKVENAAFAFIEERREMIRRGVNDEDDVVLRSPTLRDLLQEEVDLSLHAKLPRLKEKSAAMGLLWVRRQLHYQHTLFANMYTGKPQFVEAAYVEVYNAFHGWAVQKIFNYSFQAAPEKEVILRYMNPEYLEDVLERAKKMHPENDGEHDEGSDDNLAKEEENKVCAHDISASCVDEPGTNASCSGDDCDENPLERLANHIHTEWDKLANHMGSEIEKLANHVGSEWDKLATSVIRMFDKTATTKEGSTKKSGGSRSRGGGSGLHGEELEAFVDDEMTKSAFQEIAYSLVVTEPLIDDLAGMFAELNMDDPTKV